MKIVDEINEILTVGGLIKELQKYDSALLVYTEGCDCYGEANGVQHECEYSGDEYILITRIH